RDVEPPGVQPARWVERRGLQDRRRELAALADHRDAEGAGIRGVQPWWRRSGRRRVGNARKRTVRFQTRFRWRPRAVSERTSRDAAGAVPLVSAPAARRRPDKCSAMSTADATLRGVVRRQGRLAIE